MALDIFFTEDIRNAILAADEASSAMARVCVAVGEDPMILRAYREGYKAALATIALAFGIAPGAITGRNSLTKDLLEAPIEVLDGEPAER